MPLTALIQEFPSIYRRLWSFGDPSFGDNACKPPFGAKINRNHPDARRLELFWLFNEDPGSAVAYEYAGPYRSMDFVLGGTTVFGIPFSSFPNINGIVSSLANNTPGSFASVGGPEAQPKFDLSQGFTIEVLMSITDASSETTYLSLGAASAKAVSIARGTSGEDRFYMTADGSTIVTAAGSAGTAGNSVHAVWDGTSMKVYSNGILVATQANADPPFLGAGQEWLLMQGSFFSPTGACGGSLLYAGVWSRPMNLDEITQRLDAPFDMFQTAPLFAEAITAPPDEGGGGDPGPGPDGGGLSGDVDICSLLS